jgi:DNA-nicking Smr family endonuclease
VISAINDILALAKGQTVEIRIITGKGHHSKGRAPQLISEIHHVVEATFSQRIVSIEVSPHELNLGGMYLKGHFDVKLR